MSFHFLFLKFYYLEFGASKFLTFFYPLVFHLWLFTPFPGRVCYLYLSFYWVFHFCPFLKFFFGSWMFFFTAFCFASSYTNFSLLWAIHVNICQVLFTLALLCPCCLLFSVVLFGLCLSYEAFLTRLVIALIAMWVELTALGLHWRIIRPDCLGNL